MDSVHSIQPAPAGRRNATFPGFLRPVRGGIEFLGHAIHGFRSASPVATSLRPFGAARVPPELSRTQFCAGGYGRSKYLPSRAGDAIGPRSSPPPPVAVRAPRPRGGGCVTLQCRSGRDGAEASVRHGTPLATLLRHGERSHRARRRPPLPGLTTNRRMHPAKRVVVQPVAAVGQGCFRTAASTERRRNFFCDGLHGHPRSIEA